MVSSEGKLTTELRLALYPQDFGINESHLWQCSMLIPGSLADICATHTEEFNMSLRDWSAFIPQTDAAN